MGDIRSYKDLIVWQRGRKLVHVVYSLARSLPKEELFSLAVQMKRAAISIPSNIAEGYGRNYRPEYIRFLNVARGSCFELETQMILCTDLGFLSEQQAEEAFDLLQEIGRLLISLIRKLEGPKVGQQ